MKLTLIKYHAKYFGLFTICQAANQCHCMANLHFYMTALSLRLIQKSYHFANLVRSQKNSMLFGVASLKDSVHKGFAGFQNKKSHLKLLWNKIWVQSYHGTNIEARCKLCTWRLRVLITNLAQRQFRGKKTHYESLIRILNSLQSSVMVIQISTREYKIDCGLSFYYQLTICQLDSLSILQDYHTLVCSK